MEPSAWIEAVAEGIRIAMERNRGDFSPGSMDRFEVLAGAQDELIDLSFERVGMGRYFTERYLQLWNL